MPIHRATGPRGGKGWQYGTSVLQVRYIQQDQAQLSKHRQLKQAKLRQRKRRNNLLLE